MDRPRGERMPREEEEEELGTAEKAAVEFNADGFSP